MNKINIKFRQEGGKYRIMISSRDLLITTFRKDINELKENLK